MSKKNKKEPEQTEEIKETEVIDEAEETAEPQTEETVEIDEEDDTLVVDPKDLEIADLKDKWLRTAAEYDNYRKRAAKERLELTPEITAKTLTEFLPVMDSLEHALAAPCSDPGYKKGVELIKENFVTALQNLGVEEISSDGEPFDPMYHQAVQQVEKEDAESGTVAATFQKGYKIGDRVLRFAMVSVVK
ncbi:MAG: nucleotide exchange factor GrpE [Eubacterium sp.]|nr:nucleotide exchange factor GrpE [Eubacterium sp.]